MWMDDDVSNELFVLGEKKLQDRMMAACFWRHSLSPEIIFTRRLAQIEIATLQAGMKRTIIERIWIFEFLGIEAATVNL